MTQATEEFKTFEVDLSLAPIPRESEIDFVSATVTAPLDANPIIDVRVAIEGEREEKSFSWNTNYNKFIDVIDPRHKEILNNAIPFLKPAIAIEAAMQHITLDNVSKAGLPGNPKRPKKTAKELREWGNQAVARALRSKRRI